MSWGSSQHNLKLSDDGSYTAFSKEYDEHYHSTKDGALKESLLKHVCPAFLVKHNLDEINILDICYGLGFNTLSTLLHVRENYPTYRVNIYSPELDASLIDSLKDFIYPKEFEAFREIILALSQDKVYQCGTLRVEIFVGDAREYVKRFSDKFDIVYQDAFSPSANPVLWTKEYFSDIKKAMKKDGVLTTYSTALKTRLALYENGFNIYINSGEEFRDATVASQVELDKFLHVDMKHKISCNPNIEPLRD
ncbi:MAG: MnmC family methyltransferase [Campylobacterota bacterium]|nr:MnmC family methyltransferase [Campylobacterota bacterium]